MAINSVLARRFQRNLLRKIAGSQYNPVYDVQSPEYNDAAFREKFQPIADEVTKLHSEANRNTAKVLAHGDPQLEEMYYNQFQEEESPNLYGYIMDRMRKYTDKDYIDPDDPANAAFYPQKDADPIAANAERAIAEKKRRKAKIKALIQGYAPWVGGGAALGALLGGGIGYGVSKGSGKGTLLGVGLGALGGGAAGGLGKYLYNKRSKK